MKRKIKHLTALLCALVLALSLCPAALAAGVTPRTSRNTGRQAYRLANWSEPVTSYLFQNDQSGLTRVECTGGGVLVEEYDSSFKMLNQRTLPLELPLWGGFYAGSTYNFVIFGQSNPNESDSVEIMRVVKYSKDWKRLGSASIFGEQTKVPFEAGSLRCVESNGLLHIHTSHKMYKSQKDGLNHQSSLTLSIQESTMTYERTLGFYVSHSFDQYALIDQQGNLVTVDLGDAYPFRGIVMQRIGFPLDFEKAWSLSLHDIFGKTGDNGTFTSLGGLAETGSEYVTAFSTSRFTQDRIGLFGEELVYLIYTNKNDQTSRKVQISTVKGASKPVLVSTGLGGGYVLWNGGNRAQANDTLYYRTYAGGGSVGELKTAKAPLSDCQPIVYNGKVTWYVTDTSAPTFYQLDASGLKAVKATAAPGAAVLPGPDKSGIPAPNAPKSSRGIVISGKSGGSASGSSGAEDIYCQGCGYLIRKAGSGKLPDFNNGGAANAFIYRCSKCYNYYFCHQCSKDPANEALYLQHVKTCQG